MFSIYAPYNNMNFHGFILTEPRYNPDGTFNKNFRINKEDFYFDIIGSKTDSIASLNGDMDYRVKYMTIETLYDSKHFVIEGYVEYDGNLYQIRSKTSDPGPNKNIYKKMKFNPVSTTIVSLELIQE